MFQRVVLQIKGHKAATALGCGDVTEAFNKLELDCTCALLLFAGMNSNCEIILMLLRSETQTRMIS